MNQKSLDKKKSKEIKETLTRRLNKKWSYKQGDMKIDDKVFHINFYGKSAGVYISNIQVNIGFRTMTKWELFKHLCWRIWNKK